MIKIFVILVIVAIGAYFTRPNEEALRHDAQAKLAEATSSATQQGSVGGMLNGAANEIGASVSGGTFEDFYVVTRYSTPDAAHPTVQCWGAFTKSICNRTAS